MVCSRLHCTMFSRRRHHSLILNLFKERLWQLLPRMQRLLHFLVLAQTWNFCSGKPSPEALPKQHIPPDSDLGCYGHNVMFGSMDVVFTLIASGGVRRRALSCCSVHFYYHTLHEYSNPWPKNFSSLILTADLDPWFQKHNACLSCARDVDRHRDVGVLMLHYQVESHSPGGATSSSKVHELGYYRHVHYTLALMCANNRIDLL